MATKPLIKESLFFLNICGLSPKHQNKWIKTKAVLALTLLVYIEIELALQAVINWRGLNSLEEATTFAVTYQMIFKAILISLEGKKFVKLLNKAEKFWHLNECDSELQNEIKSIYAIVKRLMKMYIGLILVTLAGYFLKPLFTVARTLPFDSYHPINRYASPQYQLQYIAQILVVSICIMISTGFDGLFVSFTIHINCQLKMIKQKFSKMPVRIQVKGDDINCLEEIKKLVEHHNFVLGCVKDMDNTYSILLLSQFVSSAACICVGLVSIIANGYPPDLQNFTKYSLYVATMLGQLFYYCAAGTYLITENESVSEAVYESDWWVKTQPQLRRAYVLVIQRANKTEKLTAGGMFTLDLESFTSVVKTSLSFFTLVQAMYSRT